MFPPPFSEEITPIWPDVLSSRKEMYSYFLRKAFSTKNTSLHFLPYSPVCLVTRVLPSICSAYSITSEGFVAIWTPPLKPDYLKNPLPLPPACTCAFITTSTNGLFLDTFDISLWATAYASSGVVALKLLIKKGGIPEPLANRIS